MSIENGVTAGASKGAASALGGHGVHGKNLSTGAVPGDFATLLMNLDGEVSPVATGDASDAALGAAESEGTEGKDRLPMAVETDELQTASDSAPQSAPLSPDGSASAVEPVAMMLASVALTSGADKVAAAAEHVQLGEVPKSVGARGIAPQATSSSDFAAGVADKTEGSPLQSLEGLAPPGVDDVRAAQPALRSAAMNQRLVLERERASERNSQIPAEQGVNRFTGEAVAEGLRAQLAERLTTSADAALLFQAVGGEEWGALAEQRRGEKSSRREGGVAELGVMLGQLAPIALRADAVPAAAPDAGLMTQTRVAEQVSYWVSHGVQNAELELEGLGEGPVGVNIRLQGQEARVEFRAEQVQTRQLLQDTVSQLRELLAREGLVLSDVSVGGSGAGGAGERQPQARPGLRQAAVVLPDLVGADQGGVGARPRLLQGRSVDLFV